MTIEWLYFNSILESSIFFIVNPYSNMFQTLSLFYT